MQLQLVNTCYTFAMPDVQLGNSNQGETGGGSGNEDIPYVYPCETTPDKPFTATNNIEDPGDCEPPGPGTGWEPIPWEDEAMYNEDSLVIVKLKKQLSAIKHKRDSVWQLARQNNWEYFFYLKKQGDSVVAVGITTDSMENEIILKKHLLYGSTPEGDYHTHQDSLAKDRHLHDPADIDAGNGQYVSKQDFASYVDCGDTIYVLVTQNITTFKTFVINHNFENEQGSWFNPFFNSNNRRSLGITKLKELIGTTTNSGLGLYKTTESTFTNFVKIN